MSVDSEKVNLHQHAGQDAVSKIASGVLNIAWETVPALPNDSRTHSRIAAQLFGAGRVSSSLRRFMACMAWSEL